jgi:hypothetical protein
LVVLVMRWPSSCRLLVLVLDAVEHEHEYVLRATAYDHHHDHAFDRSLH